jgi:hypothetical protein
MQTKNIQTLIESMHPLITPKFIGTNDEMITAINFWVTLVSQLRALSSTVTIYENREAIIKQVEQEIASLRSELENVSATVTTDDSGAQSMTQPKTGPDDQPELQQDQVVDLSVFEEKVLADMRRLAGLSIKRNSLADALKGYKR